MTAIARMQAKDLRHDADAETRPDHPSGLRRKASHGTMAFHKLAEGRIEIMKRRPSTKLVMALIVDLRKCKDEFDSWHVRAPLPEERSRWIGKFLELDAQCGSVIRGDQ